MTRKGWVDSEWRVTGEQPPGALLLPHRCRTRQLATERAEWERTVTAVNGVLNWAGGTK